MKSETKASGEDDVVVDDLDDKNMLLTCRHITRAQTLSSPGKKAAKTSNQLLRDGDTVAARRV